MIRYWRERAGRIEEVVLTGHGATFDRGDGSESIPIISRPLDSRTIVAAMKAFTRAGWVQVD